MECLKDYIGIKWPGAAVPDSGLYVNQLPGVSLKSIDNLANAEQITFLGVWDDVQTRSLTRLRTHVTNYFGKRYQLRSITESLGLPEYFENGSKNTAAGANYRGFTFDMGWYASPLAAIHIENLRLYLLADAPDLEIKVFNYVDANSATVIDTFTIQGVAGWNEIKVQKNYSCYRVFVGYDATDVESVYMPIQNGWFGVGAWPGLNYWWGVPQSPYQGILRGAQSDKPFANGQELNNSFGLSGRISVVCAFDEILCANKATFAQCLWYLLGYELMTERMYSERLNRYTTIDAKKASELRAEFEATFKEEMAAAFDGIELATWDGCIMCNAQVQLVHALP